jgi:hypothetical protein
MIILAMLGATLITGFLVEGLRIQQDLSHPREPNGSID